MTTARFYRWPRRGTKRFAMLLTLLGGLRVTHLNVLDKARTYRAAAVVHALKDCGFPIVSDLQTIRDASGRSVRIAYYSIPAGELGEVLADAARKWVAL